MAREHLTDRRIKQLLTEAKASPPQDRREVWHDDPIGLGLRIAAPLADAHTGAPLAPRATWQVMYRNSDRRLRRFKLGTYPALPLADARERALAALRTVELGGDPATDKTASRARPTFEHLAHEYLERHAKRHKKSWRKDADAIERELLPAFGNRIAADIEPHEIATLLAKIRDRGAAIWANRVLEIVRRIYSWGCEPGQAIVAKNPAGGLKKPAKENRADRWLKAEEIAALWPVLADHGAAGDILALILVTGQRPGEARRMRGADIDLADGWWTVPAEDSKNGKAHAVALNAVAVDILRPLVQKAGNGWLFPQKGGAGAIAATFATLPMREILQVTGLVPFTPHALRATAATHMGSEPLSLPQTIIAKVLNHADMGITARYVRHSYDREKRRAADAWGNRLGEIVGKATLGNVIAIRGGAA